MNDGFKIIRSDNGVITYKGFIKNNKKNGKGTYYYNNRVYKGTFKDDNLEGYGTCRYKNHIKIEAEWKNNYINKDKCVKYSFVGSEVESSRILLEINTLKEENQNLIEYKYYNPKNKSEQLVMLVDNHKIIDMYLIQNNNKQIITDKVINEVKINNFTNQYHKFLLNNIKTSFKPELLIPPFENKDNILWDLTQNLLNVENKEQKIQDIIKYAISIKKKRFICLLVFYLIVTVFGWEY